MIFFFSSIRIFHQYGLPTSHINTGNKKFLQENAVSVYTCRESKLDRLLVAKISYCVIYNSTRYYIIVQGGPDSELYLEH